MTFVNTFLLSFLYFCAMIGCESEVRNVTISEKLYRLRNENGLTQSEFGEIAGATDKAVSTWERGIKEPRMKSVRRICAYFGIDLNAFTDIESEVYKSSPIPDNVLPLPNMKTVPLVGTIACGEPILAVENVEGNVSVPENVHADFALRCKGDSMTGARINDGDLVFIRQQPTVDDGQIAAVQIGDDATLKRVYHSGKALILQAENPAYKPIIVDGDSSVRVLGLAVAFISPIR